MPQPAAVTQAAEELATEFQRIWALIIEQQRLALGLRGRNQRRRRLRVIEQRIESLVDEADAASRRWIAQNYPVIYRLGAVSGAKAAGAVFDSWVDLHLNALERLAADTFSDILSATQFVRADTKRFIAEAAKGVSTDVMGGTPALRGGTLLERQLQQRGIAAVIYRDGSRHGLSEYAQMVVRTKTAVAYNTATLNAGQLAGVVFYEVFDGPNCIAEGTPVVFDGGVIAAQRVRYKGPLVRIRTATHPDGFAVSPNHPVMTGAGWRAADQVNEGDDLVYDRERDGVLLADLQLDQVPRVEDVFQSFRSTPGSLRTSDPNDFHGDGARCEGEVEVVLPTDCLLLIDETSAGEHDRQSFLMLANSDVQPVSGLSGSSKGRQVSADTSNGIVGRSDLVGSGFGAGMRPLKDNRAVRRAELPLSATLPGASKGCTTLLADEVGHDRVLAISTEEYDGWVYDFSTVNGHYYVNGIVVHNCGWTRHEDTDAALGKIVTYEESLTWPISHPQCRRSFGARPEIRTADQAAAAGRSVTPEQTADIRRADAERAAVRSRRAQRQRQRQRTAA